MMHSTTPARGTLTPTEVALRDIWAAVLEVPTVGPDDTFLDLGGDSVLATLCLNRIRAVFDTDLPADVLLLDVASLRDVASEIDRSRGNIAMGG